MAGISGWALVAALLWQDIGGRELLGGMSVSKPVELGRLKKVKMKREKICYKKSEEWS